LGRRRKTKERRLKRNERKDIGRKNIFYETSAKRHPKN
jgi:hypothetical protein